MLFAKLFFGVTSLVLFIWVWMAFISAFIFAWTTWQVIAIALVLGLYKWGPQLSQRGKR